MVLDADWPELGLFGESRCACCARVREQRRCSVAVWRLVEIQLRPTLALPGPPSDPPGDTIVEQVVSATTQKLLELAAGISDAIGKAGYALEPDFATASLNLPLMGGGNISVKTGKFTAALMCLDTLEETSQMRRRLDQIGP